MPERSSKPVVQKLGLKLDQRAIVLNAPQGFKEKLKGAPKLIGEFDFIHVFAKNSDELDQMLPKLRKALRKSGVLWVSWRKGDKQSGLGRDPIHDMVGDHRLEGVSLIAIDDDWAAMKVLYPKAERERRSLLG